METLLENYHGSLLYGTRSYEKIKIYDPQELLNDDYIYIFYELTENYVRQTSVCKHDSCYPS